ncbi:MAG: hypothetical protein DRH26_06550 [Deltaproteobacteria bacterium]|nr:MAG: hypothetical protein DRH26_06550 [Deltaproteobacteria bacterium]
MTLRRKLEWLLVALTAGLLISLKHLHYGVTQYKLFLLILLAWSLIMIIVLRSLNKKEAGSIDKIEP